MAVTPAQKQQIRKFVAANYAPKLRRGALKKVTLKAQSEGLGFITAAQARKKAGAPGAPAAPGVRGRRAG